MNIKELENLLNTKSPKEIFGDNPDSTYRTYATICHPDICGTSEIFIKLKSAYDSLSAKIILKNGPHEYKISESPDFDGDISSIYFDDMFALKVSKHPKVNSLLEKEAKTLGELYKCDEKYFLNYLPKLHTSFSINNAGGTKLTCNVFNREKDSSVFSLKQILGMRRYKNGLPLEDFAWMFNRLLTGLGYIHLKGYYHGCITPEHLLVDVKTHGGTLIDFIHAEKFGSKINVISSSYKGIGYYPDEVEKKIECSAETDLYTAASLGIMALGGESRIEPRILKFLKGIRIANIKYRPDNAWSIHDEFKDLLRVVVGKRKFKEFILGD